VRDLVSEAARGGPPPMQPQDLNVSSPLGRALALTLGETISLLVRNQAEKLAP
jgi:hypothetical protein